MTEERLEYLRELLREGTMSYGELAELQDLAATIDEGDVELLEAAGVPEYIADRYHQDYVNVFIHGYCVAMLWANTSWNVGPEQDPSDLPDIEPVWWQTSANPYWGIDAFDPDSKKSIIEDCRSFVFANANELTQADEILGDYGPEQAGHDFALTRNGHGAGFWDRGLGDLGQQLTEAAHPYGESHAWIFQENDPANDDLAHLD